MVAPSFPFPSPAPAPSRLLTIPPFPRDARLPELSKALFLFSDTASAAAAADLEGGSFEGGGLAAVEVFGSGDGDWSRLEGPLPLAEKVFWPLLRA